MVLLKNKLLPYVTTVLLVVTCICGSGLFANAEVALSDDWLMPVNGFTGTTSSSTSTGFTYYTNFGGLSSLDGGFIWYSTRESLFGSASCHFKLASISTPANCSAEVAFTIWVPSVYHFVTQQGQGESITINPPLRTLDSVYVSFLGTGVAQKSYTLRPGDASVCTHGFSGWHYSGSGQLMGYTFTLKVDLPKEYTSFSVNWTVSGSASYTNGTGYYGGTYGYVGISPIHFTRTVAGAADLPNYPTAPKAPTYPTAPKAPTYPAAPVVPTYPSSPTSPTYPNADKEQSAIEDLDTRESQLIAGGQPQINDSFTGGQNAVAQFQTYLGGFRFFQEFVSKSFGSMPWLYILIAFAGSIGLFASLLGVIGNIYSKTADESRRDAEARLGALRRSNSRLNSAKNARERRALREHWNRVEKNVDTINSIVED